MGRVRKGAIRDREVVGVGVVLEMLSIVGGN